MMKTIDAPFEPKVAHSPSYSSAAAQTTTGVRPITRTIQDLRRCSNPFDLDEFRYLQANSGIGQNPLVLATDLTEY